MNIQESLRRHAAKNKLSGYVAPPQKNELTDAERQKLVESVVSLCKLIAKQVAERMRYKESFDDLFQVAYLGACKAATTFDSTKSEFTTYVVMPVYSECARYIMKQYKTVKVVKLPDGDIVGQEGMALTLQNDDFSFEIQDELRRLPKIEREYIDLYFCRGYLLREIGKKFGVTRGGASGRIIKILDKLRKRLAT